MLKIFKIFKDLYNQKCNINSMFKSNLIHPDCSDWIIENQIIRLDSIGCKFVISFKEKLFYNII
jgi:hypothetical protein